MLDQHIVCVETDQVHAASEVPVNVSSSPEFAIGSIRYPSATDGYIAPGMSVYLTVRFNPSSSAEFDDEITILTEDNIFKVPLLARKELPSLNLPSSLDCKSCWLGDELGTSLSLSGRCAVQGDQHGR
jgi:hypothetical protein